MDNLGSHKGMAVRRAIRAAGARLFLLPKYAPDLNPIERVFAKLKRLLRKAAARTLEGLVAAIGQLLGAYTPDKCAITSKRRLCINLASSRPGCAHMENLAAQTPPSGTSEQDGPCRTDRAFRIHTNVNRP
jgi:transposase